jgi:rod shape determining protein RodA
MGFYAIALRVGAAALTFRLGSVILKMVSQGEIIDRKGPSDMNFKRLRYVDKRFMLALLALCVIGLVVLASAGSNVSQDPNYYMKRQIVWIGMGCVVAMGVMLWDYRRGERMGRLFYGLTVLLLAAVLLLGEEKRGTVGWISLGPLPSLQPAEFTKIFMVFALADFLNRRKDRLNNLKELLPLLLYASLPFLLIAAQPDLGTALVYVALILVMMFVAGANAKLMLKLILFGVVLLAGMFFLHFQFGLPIPLDDYQIKRLTVFLDPYSDGMGGRDSGWNTIQSLIAIGSGGLWGKGLYNGTQVQLNFLPEHHTDFIYAVIGEELGFAGSVGVLLLFVWLLRRTLHVGINAQDRFGTLLVAGISAIWLFHIFENVGMSIGLMPITGIPLPFLSYGGSAMLTNFVGVGLILSVNVRGKKIVF